MNLSIKSEDTNLGILSSLIPDIIVKPKGKVDVNLNLVNTIYNPKYKGYINIENGSFGFKDGLKSLKNFNSNILFKYNKIEIQNTFAKIGRGILEIAGYFYMRKFGFKNFDLKFDVKTKKGIEVELNSLKIPQSSIVKLIPSTPSKGDIKGSVQVKGTQEKYFIKGDLNLQDTSFTYPPKSKKDSSGYYPTILENAIFDVSLKAGNNTWFENELVNIVIDGNMHFKGPVDKLNVNGDVNFLRGDISYLGVYFKIKEGDFALINNEPYIALKAESDIQRQDSMFNRTVEDTILLTVEHNKLSNIKLKFESLNYPGTSPQEAMGLAVSGGVSEDMSSEDKELYLRREFFRLIDASLTTPLVKMFVKSTGLADFVKVKTSLAQKSLTQSEYEDDTKETDVTDLLTGSSFVVGKYINPNLFVSYSLGLEEDETLMEEDEKNLYLQHQIEAKLKLKKNLYLKGLLGIDKTDKRDDKQITVEYSVPFGGIKKFFKKTSENKS
jgi:hypothetical protein